MNDITRVPIPKKPRPMPREDGDYDDAPATSYSEGEEALEELYQREGR